MINLRQIALVARDLDATVARLGEVLGLRVAFNDPGVATFGLVNAVLPLGTQFVEVVSPTREGTAAGRQLERLGGDGGYMVITHTDDQTPYRRRAEAMGIRTALEADDHGYKIWQLHPGDTGGSFLEIDFQPGGEDPNGPWMPAGPDWQRAVCTDVVDGITAVELSAQHGARERWMELLRSAHFDNAQIRWTDGTRGLVAVDVHATDRARAGEGHEIAGVRFTLV
jgi:catechol 2,3-dioxygenase-like lactoylglutathione lyase family enzyme